MKKIQKKPTKKPSKFKSILRKQKNLVKYFELNIYYNW